VSYDALLTFAVFAFVASITPGPNNFLLLATAANFGLARTFAPLLGVVTGFTTLLLAVGLGLGALLIAFPQLHMALKILGSLCILYLSWRIASARSLAKDGDTDQKPITFLQAAAMQWINPKAWVVSVTAMAVYTSPQQPLLSVFVIAFLFSLIAIPTLGVWIGFGVALRGFLSDPARLKWFNIAMGLLLAATIWPILK
jgi:threonine/homoserine/homoserine lactone efflux protein